MTRLARFYMNLDPDDPDAITPGDVMIGPRSAQLVVDARPTESPAPNRWTLTIRSLGARPRTPAEWARVRQAARPEARMIEYVRTPRRR